MQYYILRRVKLWGEWEYDTDPKAKRGYKDMGEVAKKIVAQVALPEDPTTEEIVKNRFGGESCTLPAFAVAVYDVIIGSEMFQDWKSQRKGLDWFIKYFPKQYMVLLD